MGESLGTADGAGLSSPVAVLVGESVAVAFADADVTAVPGMGATASVLVTIDLESVTELSIDLASENQITEDLEGV